MNNIYQALSQDFGHWGKLMMKATPANRVRMHHLAPDRALRSVGAAIKFVRKLGVVLRSPDPYLPSLFGAAQGNPFKAGVGGFGDWPAHAWWWDRKVSDLPDIVTLKLIRGRTTFIAKRAWPALDAAVRGRPPEKFDRFTRDLMLELRQRGATAGRALDFVQAYGTGGTKLLAKAANALQRRGLLIARPIISGNHHHDLLFELWETRFAKPLSSKRGIDPLLLICLSAASGPVPVRDVLSWLTWPKGELREAIERLVSRNLVKQLPNGDIEVAGNR